MFVKLTEDRTVNAAHVESVRVVYYADMMGIDPSEPRYVRIHLTSREHFDLEPPLNVTPQRYADEIVADLERALNNE